MCDNGFLLLVRSLPQLNAFRGFPWLLRNNRGFNPWGPIDLTVPRQRKEALAMNIFSKAFLVLVYVPFVLFNIGLVFLILLGPLASVAYGVVAAIGYTVFIKTCVEWSDGSDKHE